MNVQMKNFVWRILIKLSQPLKETAWYRGLFVDQECALYPDRSWHLLHDDRNFDLAVVGSSSGKWGFDFEGMDIKAFNWAQQPQYLQNDFRVFKCYHSFLKRGGVLIVNISPLSGLLVPDNLNQTMRYLNVLDHSLLNDEFLPRAKRLAECPVLFGRIYLKWAVKLWIKRLIHYQPKPPVVPVVKREDAEQNQLSHGQLLKDAEGWMDCWRKEFNISDFEVPLKGKNVEERKAQVAIMQELVDFAQARGYRVVFVVAPVSFYLAKHFTKRFQDVQILDFVKEVNRGVRFLNYLTDPMFLDKDLYFNSFFLNARGRKMFTRRVLADLGIA